MRSVLHLIYNLRQKLVTKKSMLHWCRRCAKLYALLIQRNPLTNNGIHGTKDIILQFPNTATPRVTGEANTNDLRILKDIENESYYWKYPRNRWKIGKSWWFKGRTSTYVDASYFLLFVYIYFTYYYKHYCIYIFYLFIGWNTSSFVQLCSFHDCILYSIVVSR